MTNAKGTPIWYEYLAADIGPAQDFYTGLLGWTAADSGVPGMDYRIASAPDGVNIAGLMQQPEGMTGDPVWLVYFATDDVDATAASAASLGGKVLMPPMSIPNVGRMAMLADPQGHPFYVMRGESEEPSQAFVSCRGSNLAHGVWNELTAQDQDSALDFYGALLGLRHEGSMPMGPLGDYKFIHLAGTGSNGEPVTIGASMNSFPGSSAGWQVYFAADDVDAALDRLKNLGGSVVQGPDQIPGGDFAVVAQDPAGVRFGFVAPRASEVAA